MLRYLVYVLTLFGPFMAPGMAAGPVAAGRYTIEVPAGLDHLQVKACLEAVGTAHLRAPSASASRRPARPGSDGSTRYTLRGDHTALRPVARDPCLKYRIDLAGAAPAGDWRADFVRVTDAILVDPGLFLRLPDGVSDVIIEFRLPPGYSVSAPWQRLASSAGSAVFQTGSRTAYHDAKVAIGEFDTYRLGDEAAAIEVASLHGTPAPDQALIRRWLSANIAAVRSVFGRFPVPRLQILVIPLGQGDEPVPWGQVSRGGGAAVHLYIDQRMGETAFMDDWVLSHELSHLFHPYLADGARWVYEGLASYYQGISRARAGMISSDQAWQDLHAGFERGRRGSKRGRTLAQASESMHAEHTYMQVYWGGAAIFLLADLDLRQSAARRSSLDEVLQAFADCCLQADRLWTEPDFLAELDRLSGSDVFTRLAGMYRDSDRFPDLVSAYAMLGLERRWNRRLGFDRDDRKAAARRAAIMRAR